MASAEDVQAMRANLIGRGVDPEQVNDLVMGLGGDAFVEVNSRLTALSDRAVERSRAGEQAVLSGLMDREVLMDALGVDPLSPKAGPEALALVRHLAAHARDAGCGPAGRVR